MEQPDYSKKISSYISEDNLINKQQSYNKKILTGMIMKQSYTLDDYLKAFINNNENFMNKYGFISIIV
jgi:hypothetical protein